MGPPGFALAPTFFSFVKVVIYNSCGRCNGLVSIGVMVLELDEGVVAMEVVEGSLGDIIERMSWRFVRRQFNGGGRSALAAGASSTLAISRGHCETLQFSGTRRNVEGVFATAGESVISRRRDARFEFNLIKTSAFSTAHT